MNLGMLPPYGSPAYWRAIRQMVSRSKVDVDRLWKAVRQFPSEAAGMGVAGGQYVPPTCEDMFNGIWGWKVTVSTDIVMTLSFDWDAGGVLTLPAGVYYRQYTTLIADSSQFGVCTDYGKAPLKSNSSSIDPSSIWLPNSGSDLVLGVNIQIRFLLVGFVDVAFHCSPVSTLTTVGAVYYVGCFECPTADIISIPYDRSGAGISAVRPESVTLEAITGPP